VQTQKSSPRWFEKVCFSEFTKFIFAPEQYQPSSAERGDLGLLIKQALTDFLRDGSERWLLALIPYPYPFSRRFAYREGKTEHQGFEVPRHEGEGYRRLT